MVQLLDALIVAQREPLTEAHLATLTVALFHMAIELIVRLPPDDSGIVLKSLRHRTSNSTRLGPKTGIVGAAMLTRAMGKGHIVDIDTHPLGMLRSQPTRGRRRRRAQNRVDPLRLQAGHSLFK